MIEPDTGIDILHDVLDRHSRLFIFTQHKYRRSGTRDPPAQRPRRLTFGLDLVKTGDKDAAYGFDDDIFETASDQFIILFYKPGNKTRDIPPLPDGIFKKDLFPEDL